MRAVEAAPETDQALPIDPRISQRRADVQQAVGRRRRRIGVSLGAAVAVVAAGFAVAHSSVLGVRHLVVRGSHHDGPAALLAAAGIGRHEPLLDIAPGRAALRLERLMWVSTASVSRSWPSTLTVTVSERVPIGQLPSGTSPAGPVALVDSSGRVLADAPGPVPDLPVLLGLGPPVKVGDWVPGSPGAGRPAGSAPTIPQPVPVALASATGSTAAALALAAGLATARVGATRIELAGDGTITALVGQATVSFGPATGLAAKVASLRSLSAAGALVGAAEVDLEVPDRPAVTPQGAAGS